MDSRLFLAAAVMAAPGLIRLETRAEAVAISNASFETPVVTFVGTILDSWQKTPKPDWYDESGGFLWSQLVGVFKNTPPGAADHLDNCDGNQAIWVFAIPEAGLFQDYESIGGTNTSPEHAFDATYQSGTSYALTVGVLGNGGNMPEGATLELSLYYLDPATNRVPVATTTITNTAELFPVRTHLTDFGVQVPPVKVSDPWAGRPIGAKILSTVTTNLQGGYWDLDNVRIEAVPPPVFNLTYGMTNGDLRLSWPSVTGFQYQVKASEDFVAWSDYAPPQSGTGGELTQLVLTSSGVGTFLSVTATPGP